MLMLCNFPKNYVKLLWSSFFVAKPHDALQQNHMSRYGQSVINLDHISFDTSRVFSMSFCVRLLEVINDTNISKHIYTHVDA